jgi:hypothetical protein
VRFAFSFAPQNAPKSSDVWFENLDVPLLQKKSEIRKKLLTNQDRDARNSNLEENSAQWAL